MRAAVSEGEGGAGIWLELLPPFLALAAAALALTLIGDEAWWTIWLLFVPAAIAASPISISPGRGRQIARIVAAVLLVAWCLVALASVGLFYVPAAVAMIVGAIRGARRPQLTD